MIFKTENGLWPIDYDREGHVSNIGPVGVSEIEESDARLVSSAPDLLETLTELVKELKKFDCEEECHDDKKCVLVDAELWDSYDRAKQILKRVGGAL